MNVSKTYLLPEYCDLEREHVNPQYVELCLIKLVEIDEFYYEHCIFPKNSKTKSQHIHNWLYQTLANEDIPQPCTINSVLTIIGAVHSWGRLIDDPNIDIFTDGTYHTLLMPRAVYDVSKYKTNRRFWNDGHLLEYMSRLLSINEDDLMKKLEYHNKHSRSCTSSEQCS